MKKPNAQHEILKANFTFGYKSKFRFDTIKEAKDFFKELTEEQAKIKKLFKL